MVEKTWVGATLLAFAATLAHLFVDFQIGLFGASGPEIGWLQAMNIASVVSIFTLWVWAIAQAVEGSRSGLAAVVVLSAFWAALANGAVALVVAPPPSAGFPYQDIAHVLSLASGVAATTLGWRWMRRQAGPVSYGPAVLAGGLILLNLGIQGFLAL